MSKKMSQLVETIEKFKAHDHLCLIYENQEEQFAAVIPFIKIGLDRGEKCVYIVDDNTAASVLEAMRSGGIDTDSAIKTGALMLLTKKETYLKEGTFDPDRTIRLLEELTDQAKQEGYSALRVTGEMTWMLGGDPGTERLMEYEAKLNYFFPENDALAICQYNRKRFSPEIIIEVIHTHPLAIYGGLVCRNFYYVPPDEFLKPDQISLQVERLLINIMERERAEEKVKVRTAERELAQESLKITERNLRTVLNNVPDRIARFDANCRYLYVNPAVAETFGISAEKFIGKTMYESGTTGNDIQGNILENMIKKAFKEGVSNILEAQWDTSEGDRLFEVMHIPEKDDSGQVVSVLRIARDITARKKAENELIQYRQHLEELVAQRTKELSESNNQLVIVSDAANAANRAKSTFLANMSHELRTPLNAILGFARLMKDAPDVTSGQRKNLDIITLSSGHLLNLINNVLDMSKIESGRMTLEEAPLDLYQLIQEMMSLLYVNADERGLSFIVEQSPVLPRRIEVDGGKLRQILINLIGNAIKYTKQGGLILRAMVVKRESPEKVRLRFEVEDTGPGISEQDRKKLFQPFIQLREQGAIETGTGLGLALCRQYVDIMGGLIDCFSEKGNGSVFFFEIPAKELPLEEVAAAPELGRVIGMKKGQPRYRLLIAEDQLENRLLLHKILEPFGFDIRDAANGKKALEIFEQWHPDLIWMDIRMPDMDGLEATHHIKSSGAGSHTKIIAITAHALEEDRMRIMQAGCDDFIRKPYRNAEIFDTLSRHLGVRFVYEEKPVTPPVEPEMELRPEQLTVLPSELLYTLHQAAIELDIDRTQSLIEQIIEHNVSIGNALKKLADKLDYNRLQKLLDAWVVSVRS